MSSGSELKALGTRKKKIEKDRKEVLDQIRELTRLKQDLDKKLKEVHKDIAKIQGAGPVVSEHAMIRFLERGLGFDMEEIRKEILNSNVVAIASARGSGKVPISKNCKAVIKNGVIVTVIGGDYEAD